MHEELSTAIAGFSSHILTNNPFCIVPDVQGQVIGLRGPLIRAKLPCAVVGETYTIERPQGPGLLTQVVAFSESEVHLAPLDVTSGIGPGMKVQRVASELSLSLPAHPLGCVVDPLGVPLNVPVSTARPLTLPLNRPPPPALSRPPLHTPFRSGIKAIDLFCPLAYGQRLGIFAGAGSGKSTLLGMIARHAEVDVVVVALVGERGREVNDFIQESLGTEGLRRAVLVVATSDESPLRRALAPLAATAIAEYYRDQGLRVLLLVDSLTRTARALREVSLAAGELPVRQGYTSSVFSEMPRLIERAGAATTGSITAFYTVLTQEENESDVLGDELRSLLDGHLVLSNKVALEGVRPAIDLTRSISRLSNRLLSKEAREYTRTALSIVAKLSRDKDLLLLGGTADKALSAALTVESELSLLRHQHPEDVINYDEAVARLKALVMRYEKLASG